MKIVFGSLIINRVQPFAQELKANGHELVLMTSDDDFDEEPFNLKRKDFALVMEDVSRYDPNTYKHAAQTLHCPTSDILLLDFKDNSCIAAFDAGAEFVYMDIRKKYEDSVVELHQALTARKILPPKNEIWDESPFPIEKSPGRWKNFWKNIFPKF
jgi:hypothetical protein